MAEKENINQDTAKKILFGSIALLILMIVIGIPSWTNWTVTEIVGGLMSVFFVAPLFGFVYTRKFPAEMVILTMFGSVFVILYKFITGMSWYDLAILMLKSFVAVSLFSVFLDLFYKFSIRRIPPIE